jgi:hypothetical protein
MGEHLLYEFLPGLRCYDPSVAARSVVLRAYRGIPSEESDDASANGSASPDAEATET